MYICVKYTCIVQYYHLSPPALSWLIVTINGGIQPTRSDEIVAINGGIQTTRRDYCPILSQRDNVMMPEYPWGASPFFSTQDRDLLSFFLSPPPFKLGSSLFSGYVGGGGVRNLPEWIVSVNH